MKPRPHSLIAALVGFAAFSPTALSAATTSTIGFDSDGNTEGFSGTNVTGLAVANGLLTGTASGGDPRLARATATVSSTPIFSKPNEETWATIVFRVRETDENSNVLTTFDSLGLVVVLNSTNATSGATVISSNSISAGSIDVEGFFTVTADISAFTADQVRYFRFDPIGGNDAANNKFEIDYVQINAVPEPSAMFLGSLGMLGLLRRRR